MKDNLITRRDTPNWKEMLIKARRRIQEELVDYPNFQNVYFSDGYNGIVLMAGENKLYPDEPYGGYFPINSRLSDLSRVVDNFIENWKECDREDYRAIYEQMREREERD